METNRNQDTSRIRNWMFGCFGVIVLLGIVAYYVLFNTSFGSAFWRGFFQGLAGS